MKYRLLKDLPGIPAGIIVHDQKIGLKLTRSKPMANDESDGIVTYKSSESALELYPTWFQPLEDWTMQAKKNLETGVDYFIINVPCFRPNQAKAAEAVLIAAMQNIFVSSHTGRALNENSLDELILEARKVFDPKEFGGDK